MAWNEPGGNGDKDPWRNRGGNQGPPDLDEVFRNFQKKFGSLFGGKGGGRGGGTGPSIPGGGISIGLILGVIFVIWMATGLYKIEEAESGVILRFGEHVETTQRGLHWHLPFPIETVKKVNVAERRSVEFKATVLTQDENIIDLQGTLQYQVRNAEDYLFNVKAPDESLEHALESALRLTVGQSRMDYMITEGRNEIGNRINQTVQEINDMYGTGLSVYEVNIQDISPPKNVRQAFQDVIQAREDKQRLINEAEAYRNEILPKARGAAARLREEADAYKQEVVARSEGESDRFVRLLKEYQKAPGVTRDRLYLEMMESVMNNSSKVMVDIKDGNNLLYLPLDKLIKRDTDTQRSSSDEDVRQRQLIKQAQDEMERMRNDLRTRETR